MRIRRSTGSCLSPVSYNLYTTGIPTVSYWPKTIFIKDTSILRSDSYKINIKHESAVV